MLAGRADIARLAERLLDVDTQLTGWLLRSAPTDPADPADPADGRSVLHRHVLAAVHWTLSSPIRVLIRQVRRHGEGQPNLLPHLDVAPVIASTRPTAAQPQTAVAAVTAARDWLLTNPQRVRAAHLQAATRVGLAIATLAAANEPTLITPAVRRSWRGAMVAAAELTGPPPGDQDAVVATALADLGHWLSESGIAPGDPAVVPLAATLPTLARALARSVTVAADHRQLFIRTGTLVPGRRGIHVARTTHTPTADVEVLRTALNRAAHPASADTLAPLGHQPDRFVLHQTHPHPPHGADRQASGPSAHAPTPDPPALPGARSRQVRQPRRPR